MIDWDFIFITGGIASVLAAITYASLKAGEKAQQRWLGVMRQYDEDLQAQIEKVTGETPVIMGGKVMMVPLGALQMYMAQGGTPVEPERFARLDTLKTEMQMRSPDNIIITTVQRYTNIVEDKSYWEVVLVNIATQKAHHLHFEGNEFPFTEAVSKINLIGA